MQKSEHPSKCQDKTCPNVPEILIHFFTSPIPFFFYMRGLTMFKPNLFFYLFQPYRLALLAQFFVYNSWLYRSVHTSLAYILTRAFLRVNLLTFFLSFFLHFTNFSNVPRCDAFAIFKTQAKRLLSEAAITLNNK